MQVSIYKQIKKWRYQEEKIANPWANMQRGGYKVDVVIANMNRRPYIL